LTPLRVTVRRAAAVCGARGVVVVVVGVGVTVISWWLAPGSARRGLEGHRGRAVAGPAKGSGRNCGRVQRES
jgi:hypothetical protein